jgi:hypothetical protein
MSPLSCVVPPNERTNVTRIKRVAAAAAVVAIPALVTVAFVASPAAAGGDRHRAPNPECKADTKTTVTTLTDRPDNGGHGVWALDKLTRTVVFTRVKPEIQVKPEDEKSLAAVDAKASIKPEWLWRYHATVTDGGTFKTFGGATLSPNAGHGLIAGTHGTVDGGYTADFIAVACWQNFQAAYNNPYSPTGTGYTGTEPATTGNFVKGDWGGKDFNGTSINNDWHWTYTTCTESMTDSQANYDKTKNEFAGDIIGKVCASPSASASVSASPSASQSSGGAVVVPVDNQTAAGSQSLPVTGAGAGRLAAVAAAIAAAGAALVVAARRRRAKFVADE